MVTNRGSGGAPRSSQSPLQRGVPPLKLRAVFPGCSAPLKPSSCRTRQRQLRSLPPSSHQVMALSLAVAPDSWRAKQDPDLMTDHLLSLLDVGQMPSQSGRQAGWTARSSPPISAPTASRRSTAGPTRWAVPTPLAASRRIPSSAATITRSGSRTSAQLRYGLAGIASTITDIPTRIPTGSEPDAHHVAFSAEEHLLLVADARVRQNVLAVICTQPHRWTGALHHAASPGKTPNDIVVEGLLPECA